MAQLSVSFADLPALVRAHERRLSRGEAVVKGAGGLLPFTPCELVIHHPDGGAPLTVGATVMNSPDEQEREGEVRLMLDEGHGPALRAFVAREAAAPPSDAPLPSAPANDAQGEAAGPDEEAEPTKSHPPAASLPPPQRLRALTIPEQVKLARTSQSLTERNTLERMLGRSGWEALLANHHVTVPEIARIARKGTVPRPLIEQIVNNQTWARSPIVRRALLTNPKLTPEMIQKVLRLTPAHELKLILKQTAYPMAVRTVAERLMGRA